METSALLDRSLGREEEIKRLQDSAERSALTESIIFKSLSWLEGVLNPPHSVIFLSFIRLKPGP